MTRLMFATLAACLFTLTACGDDTTSSTTSTGGTGGQLTTSSGGSTSEGGSGGAGGMSTTTTTTTGSGGTGGVGSTGAAGGTGGTATGSGGTGGTSSSSGGSTDCTETACMATSTECGMVVFDCDLSGEYKPYDCGACTNPSFCGGSEMKGKCGTKCATTEMWLTACLVSGFPGATYGFDSTCDSTYRYYQDLLFVCDSACLAGSTCTDYGTFTCCF